MKLIATIENELCLATRQGGRMVFKSLVTEKLHPQETPSKEFPTLKDLFNTVGKLTTELVAKIDDQQLIDNLYHQLFRIGDLIINPNNPNMLIYNTYKTIDVDGNEVETIITVLLNKDGTISIGSCPSKEGHITNPPSEIEHVKLIHDTNCIVKILHYLGTRCGLDVNFN